MNEPPPDLFPETIPKYLTPQGRVYTDAGKDAAGISDHNDCSVRALVAVSSQPYGIVHGIMTDLGRKRGRGVHMNWIMGPISDRLALKLSRLPGSCTVLHLLRRYQTGKILVVIRGHAFAIVDGVIHDSGFTSHGCIVKQAWLVEPTGRTVAAATLF